MTVITGIEVTPVSVPFARPERWAFGEHTGMTTLIVELHTDSAITGLGEIVPGGPGPRALKAAVEELTPLLVGQDACAINSNLARMLYSGGWYMFARTGNLLLAGLEMAMWDVLGKTVGQPIYRLLGGAVRPQVPYVYYLQANGSLPEMAAEAADAVARGFSTVFFKGGWDEERDLELVATLREKLGSAPKLRLDVNEAWTVGTAVRMLKKLEPFDLEFVEQPVRMDDVPALARVRSAAAVPIGANQSGWTATRILEIVRHQAADVIVTDPHQEGGISQLRKVVSLCEIAGLPVAHHAFSGLTIAMTAALHVHAVSPNCLAAGQAYPPGFVQGDVTMEIFSPEGGGAELPQAPGIGVELDRERLAAAHRVFVDSQSHPFFDPEARIEWVPNR